MTNNNKENIHWEESTTHRDKLKNKDKTLGERVAGPLIKTLNLAIKGYNKSIAKFAGMVNINIKVDELNPDQLAEELAGSGGSSFALGVLDDAIKGIRRIGVPALQSGGVFTSWAATALSVALSPVEVALDHLKDLMTSSAISGLAAEVGDLKDGQAKLNAKVDAQGKLMNKKMGDLKTELQGELKQQGEKFEQEIKELDRRMAQVTGENHQAIEREKKERQAQYQELKSSIQEVTNNLNRVESQLTKALNDFRSEVNERFEEQEQKIIANKKRIEEERKKREQEVQEIKDNIKLTSTNLENLRKEKEQIEDEFITYKSQINQQTAETQQAFEDAQFEFDRRTRLVEAQIEDNQGRIEEFDERLINTQREQAFQREQQQQIIEDLQETNDILHFQKHKLEMVATRMEDIHEEVHDRMDKLSQKLDERTNEALNLAHDTSQKVEQLTEQVQNIWKEAEQLQEQVKKNQEETEKAKQEAKLANERLDNLLKLQELSDFSAEQSKLDKIQKSLELKAEEAKLLATLNLLQETKKLVRVEVSEIDWRVGIKEGTEREMLRPEGMPLNPNSSWAKKYSPEQLREWGWDTRLLGEHETAPLTDETKRQEKQAPKNEQSSQAAGEENEVSAKQTTQPEEATERIEQLKAETLERLATIQQEIRTGLEEIKNSPPPPPKPAQAKLQTIQQQIQAKKQQLNQKEQKVANLAKKSYSAKNQKQLEQTQQEQQKAEKELEQAQAQLSDPSFQFEQEIEQYEEKIEQEKSEEIVQQWGQIQALSKQTLQEKPEKEEEEKEQKEDDLKKKLEELVQQIKEMEVAAAASQKTMSWFLLFLIIFLMEYVVYKRNGLPGLVILNIILAIAYYYRDTLKEYAELWGKYLLIIGYVMGNVLAYSAPEQEKYKWPSVAGFNLAILAIYAYTLYQQKQEQAKIEAHYQQQSKEILTRVDFTAEEQQKVVHGTEQIASKESFYGFKNSFSNVPTSQKAECFSQLVQAQVLEKEQAAQKELEIQQQAETLQKAAEIEKNLAQAAEGLGSPSMTWTRIKELYPQFENKSVLLEEMEKANRYLTQAEKETNQAFLTKLTRLPVPSEEENQVLSQLRLNVERFIALSTQAQYLTREEKENLPEIYPTLDTQQKLQLINSGLNNLGINTSEKKEKLVELNQALYQERQLFGLTVKEKENVLRFLTNTLNLSPEQRESLESMGISIYNASEWTITEEQKDHLLDFGLNKLTLTEEQKEQLAEIHPDQFKTFALTGEQKNILNSLAPLIREDKYSLEALEVLKSLHLKPNTTTFLTQEEIIPDPNIQFGAAKSAYLPLKIKFLGGEQRTLQKIKEEQAKQISKEKMEADKLSILGSLMNWVDKTLEQWDLKDFSYSLTDWVKEGVLTTWQTDILLTCGFKTLPKYNFFELLIYAVEKFARQNWNEFLAGNEDLAQEFEKYVNSLEQPEITINETIWEKFASSQSKEQREVVQQLNLKELIEEQINQRLGNWKPTYEEEENITDVPMEDVTYTTEEEKPTLTPSTSRYGKLFDNLSKEDAERERKKMEYQETQKKFQEQERIRREQKLSEKERKLKEDEERRAKERELAEQEEIKRREAEEARATSLQKDQEALFNKKMANIEEAKRRAEEALANQIKQNEIEEKRKRDEIEKMEKENKAEQERLAKQAQLIEEEKQKKLAAIALEDKEERQRIEKQANEEKSCILEEANRKERENQQAIEKQKNQMLKEKSEKEVEIKKLQGEVQLQKTIGEELKNLGRQQEAILREQKGLTNQLAAFRETLWKAVLDYYWIDDEAKAGTRNPNLNESGHLREWLARYPNMQFNLNFGDIMNDINWSGYKMAMQAFYRTAGNRFVTQTEFRQLLEQKVKSLDFLN